MVIDIDGTRIQISSWQRPPGPGVPAVLWLHGAGMDRTVWTLAARDPGLRGVASLAVDLPGHGGSAGGAPSTVEDHAALVGRLLDGLGIERAVLAGHSMGGLIALAAMAAMPERLDGLVLAGAAARMPVNPALIQAAENDLPKAARMIATYAVAPAGRRAAAATPGVRLAGSAVAMLERSRPGVLAADLRACDQAAPATGPCPVPALVVTGALDRMSPAKRGAELAAALGARLARLEGAGHMMMLERPDAFAQAVLPFLAEVRAGR
ncbi:alpha/beta fold hydrolase [Geminicoccus roseus]|uniref:alpha/beta fold hydrolase n=1 Tax=Geminicoccus roseus TaxID=404900 RepID=UPI00040ECAFA|nr:alpha/beta hydrolase [Geminicoccus roseus]